MYLDISHCQHRGLCSTSEACWEAGRCQLGLEAADPPEFAPDDAHDEMWTLATLMDPQDVPPLEESGQFSLLTEHEGLDRETEERRREVHSHLKAIHDAYRARNFDLAARIFVESFEPPIRNYFAHSGPTTHVEDLTQETLIAAIQALNDNDWFLHDKEVFGKYVWGIARKKRAQWYRTKVAHERLESNETETIRDHTIGCGAPVSGFDKIDHDDKLQLLEKVLNRLTDKEREIIAYWLYSRLKVCEIAEILSISSDVAYKRLSRARRKLMNFRELF